MTPTVALLPSPLLGPSVWRPVGKALIERGWNVLTPAALVGAHTGQNVLDGFLAALPTDQDLVVIPHSNAGAFVPALTTQRRVVGFVFVDALLPPPRGSVPLAPPALLGTLRELSGDDGLLPPWTEWWDEAEVATLFPSASARADIEREQQRFPITYFEGSLPVPVGWDERPAGYLAFGDTYATNRHEAVLRGWPVQTLRGHHLHMLAEPASVATELDAMLTRLGFTSSKS
jgi:hypothetical protein